MKRLIYLVGIAFGVSMAAIIGTRMSSDAMAIVVGIVFGVTASIPTSLLIAYILRQRDASQRDMNGSPGYRNGLGGHYPPVVVVTPPSNGSHPYAPSMPALPVPTSISGSRSFKIIGQEGTEAAGDLSDVPSIWDDVQ
ncbi:MAG: hypothetical protein ACE5H9_17010 [Anaerolineae bacterium]